MENGPDVFMGIVGSRRRNTFRDRKIVYRLVDWMIERHGSNLILVSGGCLDSADEFMEIAAKINGVRTQIFPIDKTNLKGKWEFTERAYARNRLIAQRSQELYCLVYPDRTGGTENTIKHALELFTPIFLVNPNGEVYLSEDGTYPKCDPVKRLLD